MPRILAAAVFTQPASCRARTMQSRSMRAMAVGRLSPAPGAKTRAAPPPMLSRISSGRCSGNISEPSATTTACSTHFSSSRTLPGQACLRSTS